MALEQAKRMIPEGKPAYIGRKITIDLGKARTTETITGKCVSLTILDKSTGSFVLTFRFLDLEIYDMTLDQDEVLNGDVLEFGTALTLGFFTLKITNTVQAGVSLKLIAVSEV